MSPVCLHDRVRTDDIINMTDAACTEFSPCTAVRRDNGTVPGSRSAGRIDRRQRVILESRKEEGGISMNIGMHGFGSSVFGSGFWKHWLYGLSVSEKDEFGSGGVGAWEYEMRHPLH